MDAETLLRDCLDKHVLLFSDCVPVKGHAASAIYDLTRGLISTFPSEYYSLIELLRTRRLRALVDELSAEERADFGEFLGFLLDHEYVTVVDDLNSFPEVSRSWDAPCTIFNAIVDVREQDHDYRRIIAELDVLGCQHLQIRAYSRRFGLSELVELAHLCRGTSIQTLEAVLAHEPDRDDEDYVAVLNADRLIAGLTLHSASEDRRLVVDYGVPESSTELVASEIRMTVKPLESPLDCGCITTRELVSPSPRTFNEQLRFNGCLNRKLSIDENGDIRNCPAMPESFGDHRTSSIAEVVSREGFRRVWAASNDAVSVCRDCPYRYACTGCRALLEDPDAADSKPLKCGYDPYTDSWTDWRARPSALSTLRRYRDRLHLPIVSA